MKKIHIVCIAAIMFSLILACCVLFGERARATVSYLQYRLTRDYGVLFGPTFQTKSEAEEACVNNNNAEIVYTDDAVGFLLSKNGGEYLVLQEESGEWRIESILEFELSHAGDSFKDVLAHGIIIIRNVGGRWIGWVEFYDNTEHNCIVNHRACEQIQGPSDRYNPETVYYIFYLDEISQEDSIVIDNYTLLYQDTKWVVQKMDETPMTGVNEDKFLSDKTF